MSSSRNNLKNVLVREGIAPASVDTSLSKMRKKVLLSETISKTDIFLEKDTWISLGNGWYQITPAETGFTSQFGLHSLITTTNGKSFGCIFEPRTEECFNSCFGSTPSYDLEVYLKSMKTDIVSNGLFDGTMQVLLAFKNFNDHVSLICDVVNKVWYLVRISGEHEIIFGEMSDLALKHNTFLHILIQIRGNSVTVDVNGNPIFTHVKLVEGSNFSGYPGIKSKGGKLAIRGWKLKKAEQRNFTPSRKGGGIDTQLNRISDNVLLEEFETSSFSGSSQKTLHYMSSDHSILSSSSYVTPKKKSLATSLADVLRLTPSFNNNGSGNSVSINSNTIHDNNNSDISTIASASNLDLASNSSSKAGMLRLGPSPIPWGSSGGPGNSSNRLMSSGGSWGENSTFQFSRSFSASKTRTAGVNDIPVESMMSNNSTTSIPLSHSFVGSTDKNSLYSGSGIDFLRSNGTNAITSISHKLKSPHPASTSQSQQTLNSCSDKISLDQAIEYLRSRHESAIVDGVVRDIIGQDTLGTISFADIAALETAKRLLNEAVVLPMLMPNVFVGIREPWKGVLLFGPPGTGKTLLAKAVANMNCSTFFNCSASTIISKYRGESEKIVRCLFEAARLCAPSVIFIDEIDAIVSSRGLDSEHEASRRLKTELFSQLDGISSHGGQGIMLLATTNCPWDLDEAIRRRLEKRIYIPLPDYLARMELFRISSRGIALHPDVDFAVLSIKAEGYSGSDIHNVCREASMMPLRRMMGSLSPQEIQACYAQHGVPSVTMKDFLEALENTKSSVSLTSIAKFLQWDGEFGSH